MRKIFGSLNWRITSRKALLIGVVVGLFFSNAEGVSLLPFPESQALISAHIDPNDGHDNYSQSVKPAFASVSKTSKTKKPESSFGGALPASKEILAVRLNARDLRFSSQAIRVSSRVFGSEPTRGPPSA